MKVSKNDSTWNKNYPKYPTCTSLRLHMIWIHSHHISTRKVLFYNFSILVLSTEIDNLNRLIGDFLFYGILKSYFINYDIFYIYSKSKLVFKPSSWASDKSSISLTKNSGISWTELFLDSFVLSSAFESLRLELGRS